MENSFKDTWETYTQSWKLKNKDEKLNNFKKSLDPDCVYMDPLTKASGWDELIKYMIDFHHQVPGGHFETVSFMVHNSRSIAQWNMKAENGSTIGTGISYGEYNEHGKLTSMTGFYEVPDSK